MDLKNLNLVQLNCEEMKSIEGGKGWREVLVEIAIEIGSAILANPQGTVSKGYNSTNYGHYGGARP